MARCKSLCPKAYVVNQANGQQWGLQFLYIGFNFTVVFFATWLYLKGGRKIKARLGFLSLKKLAKIKNIKKSKEGSSEG